MIEIIDSLKIQLDLHPLKDALLIGLLEQKLLMVTKPNYNRVEANLNINNARKGVAWSLNSILDKEKVENKDRIISHIVYSDEYKQIIQCKALIKLIERKLFKIKHKRVKGS